MAFWFGLVFWWWWWWSLSGGAGRGAGVTGRKEKEGCVVVDGIGIELNLAMNLVIFLQLALVGVLVVARC